MGTTLASSPRASRAVVALLALSSLACTSEVASLSLDAGDRALIVASERERGRIALLAIELAEDHVGATRIPLSFLVREATEAFVFRQTLAELGIEAGESSSLPAAEGRMLPRASGTFELVVAHERLGWVQTEGSALLERIRIPEVDPVRCADRGGCLPLDSDERCQVPCPMPPEPAPPERPAAPRPPAEPMISCPEIAGVPIDTARGAPRCSLAWPGSIACGADAAQALGASTCAPIGHACPESSARWPSGLPPDTTVYVDAGSGDDSSGDGSAPRPFRTISRALAAPEAAVIAIAAGQYDEELEPTRSVTLLGACTARTFVTSRGATGGVIRTGRNEVRVADLSVTAPSGPALVAGDAGRLMLERVRVLDAAESGIVVHRGGSLEARELVIRGTRSAFFGAAIYIEGGTATLSRAVIEDSAPRGLLVYGRGRAHLTDVAIRDVREGGTEPDAHALDVLDAELRGERISIERVRGQAVRALSPATRVTLDSVLVRDVRARDPEAGAIEAFDGAGLELSDFSVETTGEGVTVIGDASTSTLTRGFIERCRSAVRTSGGRARVSSVVISRAEWHALASIGSGARLVAEDVLVQSSTSAAYSTEIVARAGDAELTRVHVKGRRNGGVQVVGGAKLTARDLTVDAPRAPADDAHRGFDVAVEPSEPGLPPSELVLARAKLVRSQGLGVVIQGGASAELLDVRIEHIGPRELANASTHLDPGMLIREEASVRAERISIVGSWDYGVLAHDNRRVEIKDLDVRGTHTIIPEQRDPRDAPRASGIGLVLGHTRSATASVAGTVLLERVQIAESQSFGVFWFRPGNAIVTDLRVLGDGPGIMLEGDILKEMGARHERGPIFERVEIDGAAELGLLLTESRLEARDLAIRRTRPAGSRGSRSSGLAIKRDVTTATITAFSIEGGAGSGIDLTQTSEAGTRELRLSRGSVRGSSGAGAVLAPGIPAAIVLRGVLYTDNVTNLEVHAREQP